MADISPFASTGNTDAHTDSLRVPPHSVQAEQSVLGGLMLDNSSWDQVADRVGSNDFYRREHRLIFEAIIELAEAAKPFDVVTLAEELERHDELDNVGGMSYLGALAKDTPSAANIQAYADIVREHSVVRQLIRVGTEIADSGFRQEGRKSAELLDTAERKVFEIAEQRARGGEGFQPAKKLVTKALDRIETLFQQEDVITGVPTGFSDFDEKTSGLQPSDLVIVAGRPSMGKTTFAMNIAENVALKTKKPVQHGNAGRATRHAHDGLPGQSGPAPGAYGQVARRRVAAPDLCGEPAGRGAALRGRHAGIVPDRTARPGEAPQP